MSSSIFRSCRSNGSILGIIVLENISVAKVGTKRFSLSTKDGSSVKYCKTSSSGVMVQGLQKEIILCADTYASFESETNFLKEKLKGMSGLVACRQT